MKRLLTLDFSVFWALINKLYELRRGHMSLMTVDEVAEFLGVKDVRVIRLEREHLLNSADKDAEGNPLFNKDDVVKYKEIAERLGGI